MSTINRSNKVNSYGFLIIVITLICTLFCVCKSFDVLNDYYIWLLPLTYLFLFFICFRNRKSCFDGPGSLVFNILMPLRYVILPTIIYASNSLSKFNNNYNYINPAVFLMIYEMGLVFLMLEFTSPKSNCKSCAESFAFKQINNSWLIALVSIVILLGIGLKFKDFSGGINVILTGNVIESSKESSNVINVLWQILCVWLYGYLVILEKDKYYKDKNNWHIFEVLFFTLLFVFISFIESVSLSRWYTVVSALASLFFVCKIFPNKKKFFAVSIISPTIILMVVITAYKNGGFSSSAHNSLFSSIGSIFNSTTFDTYFSGVVNVNNAIGLKENTSIGISSFFPDAFNNMPIINHFLNSKNTSLYNFNLYIGRIFNSSYQGDQIIPLIGQSSIYFGYLLSPVLSIMFVLLFRWSDRKYSKSGSYISYAYAFISIACSVVMCMLNFTINMSWLYIRTIPFFVVLYISDKLLIVRSARQ